MRTQASAHDPRAGARFISHLIFASRWLQAPIYVGLIIAQAVYVVVFISDLDSLIRDDVLAPILSGEHPDDTAVMLGVLALVDIAMISNLLIMVVIGGYATFVSRLNLAGHPDNPPWLSHVNANVLKVKLAMAIVGISSIHLLTTFIEVARMRGGVSRDAETDTYLTWEGAMWQVIIHVVFIISALALAWIDRLQVAAEFEAKQGEALYEAVDADDSGRASVMAPPEAPRQPTVRREKPRRPNAN